MSSFGEIKEQLSELGGLVRRAHRSALDATQVVETEARLLAESTVAGSRSASAESILVNLAAASDHGITMAETLSAALGAIETFRTELR